MQISLHIGFSMDIGFSYAGMWYFEWMCLCGCIIKKRNNLKMFIMKKEKLENAGGDTMEDALIHCFLSWSTQLYLLNQSLSFANIRKNRSSRSVPLSCSFAIMRVRQRKCDSSFCRRPLMISLKWLTALDGIGNLPQSKQIWSILETVWWFVREGEGWVCGGNIKGCTCVKQGEVRKGC